MLRNKLSILLGVVALVASSGASAFDFGGIAKAWDDFVSDPVSTGQAAWGDALAFSQKKLREMKLKNVRVTFCAASDWTDVANDPEIVGKFQKETGHTVDFPRDGGKLLGSREIMDKWSKGELKCDGLKPDADLVGMLSDKWDPNKGVFLASSVVKVFVAKEVVPALLKGATATVNGLEITIPAKDSIDQWTFVDFVNADGMPWGAFDERVAFYGEVKGHASNCSKSASCATFATSLPYTVTNDPNLGGRAAGNPEVVKVLEKFRTGVMSAQTSTSKLVGAAINDPNSHDFLAAYESSQQDLEAAGYVAVNNNAVILARHVGMNVAVEEQRQLVMDAFFDFLRRPETQKRLAEKHGFRPAIQVDVTGPVAEYKKQRLPIISNVNPGVPKTVMGIVDRK